MKTGLLKYILLNIFIFIIVISLNNDVVHGAEISTISGKCGDNLNWRLENDVLIIEGTGGMYNYEDYITSGHEITDFAPWHTYADSIREVRVMEGVKSLGNHAFARTSIEAIELPNSLVSIGYATFMDCEYLNNIVLPNSVTNVGEFAFYDCIGLQNVVLSQNMNRIPGAMFSCCEMLKSVVIPNSALEIGQNAFAYCYSLSSVNLSENTSIIKSGAFRYCESLVEIKLPSKITSIEKEVFCGCKNLNVVLPASLTYLGESAFSNSGIKTLTIPNGVKKIEWATFCACFDLTEVYIPKSVEKIEAGAFVACSGIKNVYYGGSPSKWKEILSTTDNDFMVGATVHYAESDTIHSSNQSIENKEPVKEENSGTVDLEESVSNSEIEEMETEIPETFKDNEVLESTELTELEENNDADKSDNNLVMIISIASGLVLLLVAVVFFFKDKLFIL